MLNFNITLNDDDIKKFIFFKLNIKSKKIILPILIYLSVFFIILLFIILNGVSFLSLLILFVFLGMAIFNIHKIYSAYNKFYINSLDLVDKSRHFFIDNIQLRIVCESNQTFSGQYSLYDLSEFHQTTHAWYLYFSENIFIIIPKNQISKQDCLSISEILDNL